MDFITKAISLFSPRVAAQRVRNQVALQMMDGHMRKYEGAGHGRRFGRFSNSSASQNQQLITALDKLRQRSREMYQNNGYSKNAIRVIGNNVVGTGILATPNSGSKAIDDKIKALWKPWADTVVCDFDGLQSFYGLQKVVAKTVAKSGACFVRRVWNKKYKKGKILLELQLLEPEFLDTTKSGVTYDNGEYTMNGIQFDKYGKRIAYWLFDKHPNELHSVSRPVPVSDICHVFDVEDPGQIDGIPFMAPVLLSMSDFDEFADATLMKQKTSAAFAGFITSDDSGISPTPSKESDLYDRIEPGILQKLAPGEEIVFSNPPSTEGIGEYARQSQQGHAAGIGVSYEAYTGDLKGVSFSAGRMGWLESNRNYEHLQWNMMVPMFLNKVWDWFIQAAYLAGMVPEKEVPVTWTPPRREMLDPVKETNALSKQVRNGFLTWSEAVRREGYNPEDVRAEMIADAQAFDKAKLMPESDPRFDPARKPKGEAPKSEPQK